MNPVNALKYYNVLSKFKQNHPKLPVFIKAAGNIADVGTVADITVTTSQGKKITASIKVNEEDIRLLNEIRELKKND